MIIAMLITVFKLALNWLLIFGNWGFPRLELVGAGIATLVSQIIGLSVLLLIIRGPGTGPFLRLRWGDVLRPNPRVREVLRIALPGIAERLVMNTAMLSYIWVLGHYYGTLAVAAYTVGIPLIAFSWIPGQAYAQSCATLIGQALGAGKPDQATRIGWQAAGLAVFTAIILGTFVCVERYSLAGLLTSDQDMIRELGPFLFALAIAQPMLQLQFTLGGAHRGAGDSTTPLIAACVGNWMFRIPLAFGAAIWLEADISWVWYSLIFDHIARSVVLVYSFQRGKWRTKLG
jgi:putative MATE family efflux protein